MLSLQAFAHTFYFVLFTLEKDQKNEWKKCERAHDAIFQFVMLAIFIDEYNEKKLRRLQADKILW